MAPQNTGGGISLTSTPKPATPLEDPTASPARTDAGYTGPALMDPSAGKQKIPVEERPKRFADGGFLYYFGFNHRVAECVATMKAQTFKVAGTEVKEVETRLSSGELGQD